MKYLVVGGVAGGATAAARIRRDIEDAEIILFEKGEHISYANCGLPYYIGNVIEDRNRLFVQTPQVFGKKFNIDVRVKSEVLSIDREAKTVTVKDENGKTYTESYDKLLLSPGALPVVPPLSGIDNKGIFTLRNVTDADKIKNYIKENDVKDAVIIGAGFIGLEMTENFSEAGCNVSIVEMAPQVMAPLDFSMASLVHEHLIQKGVNLYLEKAVSGFEKNNESLDVIFKTGERIKADVVILSIGVRPNTTLATDAGIETGAARGIKVNEYLQTSDENIYAVGDAIEFTHPVTGKPWLNYLAGPANRQARIVADNMVFGNKVTYEGSIGTSIAKVYDMTVASTGVPAKKLKMENMEYGSATIHGSSHAGYYPDSLPLTIKITYNKESGKLYGGQIVGFGGIDARIDQISRVIKDNGTIYDLMKLEQAYAPPYSSAKDPVAVAGYVAGNIISGKMKPLYWRELRDADLSTVTLIDVRTKDEFELGSLKGAINIPLDDMRDRLSEIPRDKEIWLFCGVGLRGYLASNILRLNGIDNVKNLIGGLKLYKAATAKLPNHLKDNQNNPQIKGSSNENESNIDSNSNKGTNDNMAAKAASTGMIKTIKVDACGISCPGPIMKLKKNVEELNDGERIEIVATDAAFPRDAESWCNTTGNSFISTSSNGGKYSVIIEKREKQNSKVNMVENSEKGKTFILFSDDLDKTLATFVLANGAAATGSKVTIFCTFWGLNAIKKVNKPKVSKDIFGKMFGMMLPSSSLKLGLSKMNMGGLGSKMMRYIMKNKNIDSLEHLRNQAIESGVEIIACQMSMDVMGVKREELLDCVTIGGVATYMDRADKANVNLFI